MNKDRVLVGLFSLAAFIIFACSLPLGGQSASNDEQAQPNPTATKTVVEQTGPIATSSDEQPCSQISGYLDVYVMAGPGEAVGLDPFFVASVPFTIDETNGSFPVKGNGSGSYNDLLTRDWGTYEVSMDLRFDLDGVCRVESGKPILEMVLTMEGSQLVVVDAAGFSGEYPWQGSASVDFSIPAENGAEASGEGWRCTLHLNQ